MRFSFRRCLRHAVREGNFRRNGNLYCLFSLQAFPYMRLLSHSRNNASLIKKSQQERQLLNEGVFSFFHDYVSDEPRVV